MPDWFPRYNPKFRHLPLDFDWMMQALVHAPPAGAAWLLSSEEFSSMAPERLQRCFGAYSQDLQILVAVRRQDEWLESSYLQAVRAGLTRASFEEYLDRELLADGPGDRRLHLRSFVAHWAEVFGRDRLHVAFYREEPDYCPITAMCGLLAIPARSADDSTQGVNQRLHPVVARFLAITNRLGDPDAQHRAKTWVQSVLHLVRFGNERLTLLSPQVRERVMAHFVDDNRHLCAEFGGMTALEYFTTATTDRRYVSPEEVNRDPRFLELVLLASARALGSEG
jgi:hypothetical protein